MSYLRGPLTRNQIKGLMDPYKALQVPAALPAAAPAAVTAITAAPGATTASGGRPSLPPEVTQFFVPLRGRVDDTFYKPVLAGAAKVHFVDAKLKIDTTGSGMWMTPVTREAVPVDWEVADQVELAASDLDKEPATGTSFLELPPAASRAKSYVDWSRDFVDWLYRNQVLTLFRSPSTGLTSRVDETEQDFRIRATQVAREKRDDATEVLRKRYASKLDSLEQKLLKAQQTVAKQESQARQAQMNTAVSVGSTLLGALFGRRRGTTAINQAARGIGRSMDEGGDVGRAQETVRAVQQQISELEAELEQEVAALESKMDPVTETLETIEVRPKKANIDPQLVALVWAPYRRDEAGGSEPAW
jgi:prefoldin subunit 5